MSGQGLLSVLVLTRTLSGYTTVTSYVVFIRTLSGGLRRLIFAMTSLSTVTASSAKLDSLKNN